MGKKSKRHGATNASSSGLQINNKAVWKVVDDLWARTQALDNTTVQYLWSEYDAVRACTKSVIDKQGHSPCPLTIGRREAIPALEKWLRENGATYDPVEIAEFPEVGFAMKAKRDIKQEEKVITVPRKLMMTSVTAKEGPLGVLIARDHMLQVMPNVALALHLLNERYNPKSFWKPYIDTLPCEFTTPFYYSREDLQELQSSPCMAKSLLQIRNASKLYAHLHRLIRSTCDPSLHVYNVGFYFEDFLWAVSCVMSRQNEIPLQADGKGNALALIPLWDFCNHSEGHMTTFYNLEEQACDCYAQEDTPNGAEFRIFYGPRPNSDLLIHQGFVYMENESDTLQIKLGLSASDPAKALKKDLLDKLRIPISGNFSIHPVECPLSPQLVAFTRVFIATQKDLEHLAEMDTKDLADIILRGKWGEDEKVLDFLEKRCALLLRAYKTSIQEDTALLEQPDTLSIYAREAVKMRLCEKKMLNFACTYSQAVRQQLEVVRTLQEHGGLTYTELKKKLEEEGKDISSFLSRGAGGFIGGRNPGSSKQDTPCEDTQQSSSSQSDAAIEQTPKQTFVQTSEQISESEEHVSQSEEPSSSQIIQQCEEEIESLPQQECYSQTNGEEEVKRKEAHGVVGDSGLGMEDLVISDETNTLKDSSND